MKRPRLTPTSTERAPTHWLHKALYDSDHDLAHAARAWIESRIDRAHPACLLDVLDRDWHQKWPLETSARFWELYLAATMRDAGYRLGPLHGEGLPDLCIRQPGRSIWIEAVVAEAGALGNKDRVEELVPGEFREVPADKIVLRLTQALRGKQQQTEARLRAGRIQPGDCNVIAVNGRAVIPSGIDGNPSYIERAVFGVGARAYAVPSIPGREVESHLTLRPAILRQQTGTSVPTTFFANPKMSHPGISAVIFSLNSATDHPGLAGGVLGSDLITVRNPYATNPLPDDFPRVGWIFEAKQDVNGHGQIIRRIAEAPAA